MLARDDVDAVGRAGRRAHVAGDALQRAVLALLQDVPAPEAREDHRALLGIPNFLDVVSNAGFLLVGLVGLWWLAAGRRTSTPAGFTQSSERWAYGVFFLGVILTGFGSAWYHWQPSDATLVWDRLPMTLVFMSVLAGKEAYALEHQLEVAELAVGRGAQKKFLHEHLGRWAPAFSRRLATQAAGTALAATAGLLRSFLEVECARFDVTPGSEDLLLRPVDEASESLCASCGSARPLPGTPVEDTGADDMEASHGAP